MHLWIDADACPKAIKDILIRVAERRKLMLTLVANQPLRTPASSYVKTVQVASGFDVADGYIAQWANAGDLVITADIPLAAAVIEKGAHALNPRGELYTEGNIRARLSMRNFMDELRGSGVNTVGPAPLSPSDRRAFANQLDRFLARHLTA